MTERARIVDGPTAKGRCFIVLTRQYIRALADQDNDTVTVWFEPTDEWIANTLREGFSEIPLEMLEEYVEARRAELEAEQASRRSHLKVVREDE
jgi:hypothetical protein